MEAKRKIRKVKEEEERQLRELRKNPEKVERKLAEVMTSQDSDLDDSDSYSEDSDLYKNLDNEEESDSGEDQEFLTAKEGGG